MGILRADRVSGLGGANAITGSTSFNGGSTSGNHLLVNGVDTEFGTSGSFTMEFWMNPIGTQIFYSSTGNIGLTAITDPRTSSSSVHPLVWISGGHGGKANDVLYYYAGGSDRIVGTTVLQKNRWYHVAVVRTGGTTTMYLDGSSEGSFSDSLDYAANNGFFIGQRYTSTQYNFNGHISNFRLIKGTALYTGTFTPPTTRLTKTSGTEILCCNSSSDVTNDETGKIINVGRSSTNDTGPVASRFVPDKGEDHGTTLGDNTKFDTLSYMVPPGGTTTERSRGRGILFGGGSPGRTDRIDYIDIPSGGNSIDFGNLACGSVWGSGAGASSTRGVFWGGENQYTKLDYVTIATTGNATSFGTSSTNSNGGTCMSSETRAVYVLGAAANTMEYVTIATTGNTTDFGDQGIDDNLSLASGLASPTRGIVSGGYGPSPYPQSNTIEYITIATTGNASDFGDLTFGHSGHFGVSNTTRGVFAKGYTFPSPATVAYNTIEYITIASTGNATDFGDATNSVSQGYSHASHIRGVFSGGTTPADVNTIDYITIATTGNAADFGDTHTATRGGSGTSDCHGGIA